MTKEHHQSITIQGASEHNLKNIDLALPRGKIIAVTGVSGSGKSSFAFDTLLTEANRRFFYTLSHYSRMFLNLNSRPAVRKITGLSPAIALAQYESPPSKRASIATLTDLNEMFGVLFSRFAKAYCPKHKKAAGSLSEKEATQQICNDFAKKFVAICIPIADQKKGSFNKVLNRFFEKGFLRIYCDGKIVSLSSDLNLNQERKHTIKVLIDYMDISEIASTRLINSVHTALEESSGYVECYPSDKNGILDLDQGGTYSTVAGCPECGYSWPKLDSRYFSANSLGKCKDCQGLGFFDEGLEQSDSLEPDICSNCCSTGIDQKYSAILFDSHSIQELYQLTISNLIKVLDQVDINNQAFCYLKKEILRILCSLDDLGLGYLSLHRKIASLSTGEHQRIKLAGILSKQLTGVLYILDEPSQGLHHHDLNKLHESLLRLKKSGNTLIIVDHDPSLLEQVDWIIDLGPGGGQKGGHVIAEFAPQDKSKFTKKSLTAKYLDQAIHYDKKRQLAQSNPKYIEIQDASCHNLKIDSVRFLKKSFNIVTGVSGAGKTSLVIHTLYQNILHKLNTKEKSDKWAYCQNITGIKDLDTVLLISRSPLAKTSVSMPATYLKVFTEVRNLFSSLPAAKMLGLSASDFSLRSSAGRCKECKGQGTVVLTMKFLEDAKIKCSNCQGKRFQDHILSVHYKNLSIADVLDLTIDEVCQLFKNIKKITNKLEPSQLLGLGYLKLGQTSNSLSGGEAQRLKLAPYIMQAKTESTLLIIDEPTRGLHEYDVKLLMIALKKIVEKGTTIIITEHHKELIKQADWVIDIGPHAAEYGGQLLYEGPSEGLLKCKSSLTAKYLS